VYSDTIPRLIDRETGTVRHFTSGLKETVAVLLKRKGESLPDRALPMALPVQVQLVNLSTGVCFGAVYDGSEAVKNDEKQFKGKVK